MKLLDVLREQEESPVPNSEKNIQYLYDEMKKRLNLYTPTVKDDLGNDTYGSVHTKLEFDILEITYDIVYVIFNNNIPKEFDSDFVVRPVIKLINILKKDFDLDSYSEQDRKKIAISVKDPGIIIKTLGHNDSIMSILHLFKLMGPSSDRYQDFVPYSEIDTDQKIISRYRIPEENQVKFDDDYNDQHRRAVKRTETVFNILKKGSVDGHVYEFKQTPILSVSPFKSYKLYNEFTKTEGAKTLPTDFTASVTMYPSLLIIDGYNGEEVQDKDPELYKKVRTYIARQFNNHKIHDSYTRWSGQWYSVAKKYTDHRRSDLRSDILWQK